MKIAVVDDERTFRDIMSRKIQQYCEHKNIPASIDHYSNAEALLNVEKSSEYSIIFLDVAMPRINGIDAGRVIANKSPKTFIVYVSGLVNYAPASHEITSAVRYLMKDELEEKFDECMNTVLQRLNYQNKKILIDFTEGEIYIYRHEIVYIDIFRHLLTFHFSSPRCDSFTSRRYTLKSIQMLLGEDLFIRVEKSYLVNMAYIDSFARDAQGHKCVLKDGTSIIVSLRRYKDAKRQYFQYKATL